MGNNCESWPVRLLLFRRDTSKIAKSVATIAVGKDRTGHEFVVSYILHGTCSFTYISCFLATITNLSVYFIRLAAYLRRVEHLRTLCFMFTK